MKTEVQNKITQAICCICICGVNVFDWYEFCFPFHCHELISENCKPERWIVQMFPFGQLKRWMLNIYFFPLFFAQNGNCFKGWNLEDLGHWWWVVSVREWSGVLTPFSFPDLAFLTVFIQHPWSYSAPLSFAATQQFLQGLMNIVFKNLNNCQSLPNS